MSSYEKNCILSSVSCAIGVALAGVGGILGVLDGQIWQYVLCAVGLLAMGFAKIADN